MVVVDWVVTTVAQVIGIMSCSSGASWLGTTSELVAFVNSTKPRAPIHAARFRFSTCHLETPGEANA